jgi:hypothetical protein
MKPKSENIIEEERERVGYIYYKTKRMERILPYQKHLSSRRI